MPGCLPTSESFDRAYASDSTATDSESEYIPSETSEDRDFVVSDTDHISDMLSVSGEDSDSTLENEKAGQAIPLTS
ncbi:hypothetical protein N7468_009840 [Penicillium chermesinum]|uniref:Uncharacterized protein n=1 Tax=Penicillium chermesinum TaxID=63820 RepID=A0A9W9NBJ2_9EURO|nr:uncharacterized protein N7468_009840 [Penicillium chermesinum]KAJ5216832.1 hypothetical protein N7468_009840 [Penicillium chermesinum]